MLQEYTRQSLHFHHNTNYQSVLSVMQFLAYCSRCVANTPQHHLCLSTLAASVCRHTCSDYIIWITPPLRFRSLDLTLLTSKSIYLNCVFDSLYGFQLYWLSTGLSTRDVPRFQRVYTVPKLTQVTLFNRCNLNIKWTISVAMIYILQINTTSLCSLLSKDTKQFNCRDNFFEFLCFF